MTTKRKPKKRLKELTIAARQQIAEQEAAEHVIDCSRHILISALLGVELTEQFGLPVTVVGEELQDQIYDLKDAMDYYDQLRHPER